MKRWKTCVPIFEESAPNHRFAGLPPHRNIRVFRSHTSRRNPIHLGLSGRLAHLLEPLNRISDLLTPLANPVLDHRVSCEAPCHRNAAYRAATGIDRVRNWTTLFRFISVGNGTPLIDQCAVVDACVVAHATRRIADDIQTAGLGTRYRARFCVKRCAVVSVRAKRHQQKEKRGKKARQSARRIATKFPSSHSFTLPLRHP
jgi:hypothetical protein